MNSPSYFEIHVDDITRARNFYRELFGWKFIKENGLDTEYWRIETDGPRGGMLKRDIKKSSPMSAPNAFVCSIEVANFDQTAEKITGLGGKVALPKFAVPGKCWQGYFLDTEYNLFGIFQVNPEAGSSIQTT